MLRRELLGFLAASAVVAPGVRALAQQLAAADGNHGLIASAADALQVSDFEELARRALPPAHWGYLVSGVDDDRTLRANAEGFQRIGMKPRLLSDVSKPDLSVEVFGEHWETPLFICPVNGQRAFHADGELATAAAAKAKRHQLILSSGSTFSVEAVSKTFGRSPWQQLYMPVKWEDTVRLVRHIEDAGVPVLVWPIDNLHGTNRPTMTRLGRQDPRQCLSCHTNGVSTYVPGYRPIYEELGIDGSPASRAPATWETFDRLRALTKMKVMLKGIDTAEDAVLAVEHGVDGIIVSNHGGRATETLRPTINCLPEVVAAVGGRVPIFVDGGIRRGTDIYKALALGARAVGIGRPYIWGLAAFGQEGVERVLEILRAELLLTMKQMGTPEIKTISRSRIVYL